MTRNIKKNNAAANGVKNIVRNAKHVCPICGKVFYGFGNNGAPIVDDCVCDECNYKYVLMARMYPQSYGKVTLAQLKETYEVNNLMESLLFDFGDNVDLSQETGGWNLHSQYNRETNENVYVLNVTFTNVNASITLPKFQSLNELEDWCDEHLLYGAEAILPLLLQRTAEAGSKLSSLYKETVKLAA